MARPIDSNVADETTPKRSASFWRKLTAPSLVTPAIVLMLAGLVVGALAVAATGVALQLTSSNEFCSSCHTGLVVDEWKQSPHYQNKVGFTAGCADCHEPREFLPRMWRKAQAADEVWHQLLGTISTPEKFESHRAELANVEVARLRADNSQECRNCHDLGAMVDPTNARIRDMHKAAMNGGATCVNCHRGIAHKAP